MQGPNPAGHSSKREIPLVTLTILLVRIESDGPVALHAALAAPFTPTVADAAARRAPLPHRGTSGGA